MINRKYTKYIWEEQIKNFNKKLQKYEIKII